MMLYEKYTLCGTSYKPFYTILIFIDLSVGSFLLSQWNVVNDHHSLNLDKVFKLIDWVSKWLTIKFCQ